MQVTRDKELEDIYKIHRDYIQHEDNLVNHRTTWLITIQSFLIATFGFSYQKLFEVAEKMNSRNPAQPIDALGSIAVQYKTFLVILAFVGFATSLVALFSVRAANHATQSCRENWLRLNKNAPPDYLPGITGGGHPEAPRHGIRLALSAPVLFGVVWLAALLLIIFVVKISVR